MSDERLRELERRWLETGSLPDREAWEHALVRAGYPSRQQCYARLAWLLSARMGYVIRDFQDRIYDATLRRPNWVHVGAEIAEEMIVAAADARGMTVEEFREQFVTVLETGAVEIHTPG